METILNENRTGIREITGSCIWNKESAEYGGKTVIQGLFNGGNFTETHFLRNCKWCLGTLENIVRFCGVRRLTKMWIGAIIEFVKVCGVVKCAWKYWKYLII